jgi:hypothetical protein
MSCEIYTPCTAYVGILQLMKGKMTIGKVKSSRMS